MDAVTRLDWLSKIAANPKVACGALRVAIVLVQHHNNLSGRCDPSIRRLSEMSALSVPSVRRALRELEQHEYLSVRFSSGGRKNHTNQYDLLMLSGKENAPLISETDTPITKTTPLTSDTPITGDTPLTPITSDTPITGEGGTPITGEGGTPIAGDTRTGNRNREEEQGRRRGKVNKHKNGNSTLNQLEIPIGGGISMPAQGTSPAKRRPPPPFAKIRELWIAKNPTLPCPAPVEKWTGARKKLVASRWNDELPTIEHWERTFDYVNESDFLSNRKVGKEFRCDLFWILQPEKLLRLYEGFYDN